MCAASRLSAASSRVVSTRTQGLGLCDHRVDVAGITFGSKTSTPRATAGRPISSLPFDPTFRSRSKSTRQARPGSIDASSPRSACPYRIWASTARSGTPWKRAPTISALKRSPIANASAPLCTRSSRRSGVLSTAVYFLGLRRDPVVAKVTRRCNWRIAILSPPRIRDDAISSSRRPTPPEPSRSCTLS